MQYADRDCYLTASIQESRDDNLSKAVSVCETHPIKRILSKMVGNKLRAAELFGLSLLTLCTKSKNGDGGVELKRGAVLRAPFAWPFEVVV